MYRDRRWPRSDNRRRRHRGHGDGRRSSRSRRNRFAQDNVLAGINGVRRGDAVGRGHLAKIHTIAERDGVKRIPSLYRVGGIR